LKKVQQRRVVPKFDEEENKLLNKNIKNIVSDIGNQIHNCEQSIESLSREKTNNEIQKQLKDNMKLYLTTLFSEFTRHYEYNQEIYIRKYKELGGGEEELEKQINNEIRNENYLLKTEKISNLERRDTEIGELLKSMNNLASTFKDLKSLVMEQGTILDRIDYNIDEAAINTSKGKQHLMRASELQKKNCFRNVMLFLILFIFIETIILILKFL
jgi:syntaxin 16